MAKEKARFKQFKPEIVPGVGIMRDMGDEVPANGTAGYGTGCIFQHTDGGDATALYVNEGTNTSCDFNALIVA
jgi:hypothetical protein